MPLTIQKQHLKNTQTLMSQCCLLLILLTSVACAQSVDPALPHSNRKEVRALWVTRWDYRSPEDIEQIVRYSRWAGFNRLYFQVRGEATTFYPSKIEPWAWELTGKVSDLGKDPGWDPLQTAITQAHRYGMELHAYMNVLPAWKVPEDPPASSKHVMVRHPDWIMMDKNGRRMSPKRNGFYAFLNPAIPEVRRHIASVFKEIATNYPQLDGIHYDYIRYPGEKGDFSYDPYTIKDFKSLTGGKMPDEARALWDHYRISQIDTLLKEITTAAATANPRLEISAAVIANTKLSNTQKCQQWLEWPERGLVHTVVPMAYHYDTQKYEEFLDQWLGPLKPVAGNVIVGIYPAEKWQQNKGYTNKTLKAQIDMARRKGADGICVFSYSVLFPEGKVSPLALYLRKELFGIK